MADNFEPFFHVPQQTRRDKLRVLFNNNNNNDDDFQPLFHAAVFNPSLNIPSQSFNLCANTNTFDGPKGMGFTFMNMTTSFSSSSSSTPTTQFMYLNSTIQDFSDTPFVNYGPVVGGAGGGHQSLSLSLSSSHSNTTLPLGLNSSVFSTNGNRFGSGGGSCTSLEGSRSSVPLGPFTGYASVLNGSRFLKPAQLLLEEICDVGCKGTYGENDPTPRSLSENEESVDFGEQTKERSTFVLMLDEVYKRYKMYYQQIQAIITSFESVAGLSNAAPFANLALQALSKHFQCLKNSIKDQLQCASKSHDHIDFERNETQRSKNSGNPYVHKPFRPTGYVDQPVWRPQRGLPERAVTVLRAWLFEHFLHPYPTDTDKLMLAKQAGLSRNQVSNWFINARVRIWKPMVEEIHNLETRQSQKDTQREEPSRNTLNNHLPTSGSFEFEIPSTSIQKIEDFTLKRSREDLTTTILGRPMNLQSDNLLHQNPQSGVGVGNAGGVSLTLGLPPNGMGLSESFTMHAARRFGLDAHGEGSYILNSFASQNQQFGRDIAG